MSEIHVYSYQLQKCCSCPSNTYQPYFWILAILKITVTGKFLFTSMIYWSLFLSIIELNLYTRALSTTFIFYSKFKILFGEVMQVKYFRKFIEDYQWKNTYWYIFLKSVTMNLKGVGNVQCKKQIKELSKLRNTFFICEWQWLLEELFCFQIQFCSVKTLLWTQCTCWLTCLHSKCDLEDWFRITKIKAKPFETRNL